MNQDNNNLNSNNFNTQANNGVPNNQPLNNQNMNINQQSINPQPQATQSFGQPVNPMNIEQPVQQPMNNFESGNVNNQNFDSKPPKKMNLGFIIGIVVAVVIAMVGVVLGIKLLSSDKDNSNNEKQGKEKIYDNRSTNFDINHFSFYIDSDEKNIFTFKSSDKVSFYEVSNLDLINNPKDSLEVRYFKGITVKYINDKYSEPLYIKISSDKYRGTDFWQYSYDESNVRYLKDYDNIYVGNAGYRYETTVGNKKIYFYLQHLYYGKPVYCENVSDDECYKNVNEIFEDVKSTIYDDDNSALAIKYYQEHGLDNYSLKFSNYNYLASYAPDVDGQIVFKLLKDNNWFMVTEIPTKNKNYMKNSYGNLLEDKLCDYDLLYDIGYLRVQKMENNKYITDTLTIEKLFKEYNEKNIKDYIPLLKEIIIK